MSSWRSCRSRPTRRGVRALVSETPLASQEHNEAARHADAMVRARDALDKVVADLERRQDELLAAVATGKQ